MCSNLMCSRFCHHTIFEWIHPTTTEKKTFFHRSCFRRVDAVRSLSARFVTRFISSLSPICFSVQQFFFATSFRILNFFCGFTVTNVLATLYAIAFLCSFFILRHVCVGCSWKNVRVFKMNSFFPTNFSFSFVSVCSPFSQQTNFHTEIIQLQHFYG